MKRTIYNTLKITALLAAAFLTFSCAEKEPEVKETPVFPEMIEDNDIVPGSEITLSFVPNMDWTLSIPEENYKWFKFKDGNFEQQTLSGSASRLSVRVTILTDSEPSFSLRSTKIYLTMGGQTEAIAQYMLQAEGRVVEVCPAKYTENGFTVEDGGYVYEKTPLTSEDVIELVWNDNENVFTFPIQVKSNFEWEVTWPEWARADISAESRIGELALEMYGVDANLPYEAAEGKVIFSYAGEEMASFNVKIAGVEDKFKYNIGGHTTLTFDHAGYFRGDSGTYSKEPIDGTIYGPKESRVVVLELTENGYAQVDNSWLNLSLDTWDNVSGSAVLQTRNLSLAAPRYLEPADRNAVILFLPATAPENLDEIFEADKVSVKQEYSQYAIPVTQLGRPSEYFTFEATITEREFAGIYYEKASSAILPEKNFKYALGAEAWQYEISYKKSLASTKSTVYYTEPYETVEVYDVDGKQITENVSEHWLSFAQLGDGLYGQVVMDKEKLPKEEIVTEEGDTLKVPVSEIDGYLVFKNDSGEALCAIHCFYVAEELSEFDVLVDASSTLFMYPEQALAAGVTAYMVTAGPTYQQFIEMEAPIYILTSTRDNQVFTINTSKVCSIYNCQGTKDGPEMVTVDNQIFSDPVIAERIAKYEKDKAKYEEDKAAGLIVDPNREKEPKYPDTADDRSTMGLLKFGETSFITRTYPGYSEIRMKMPEPKEGEAPVSTYQEIILFQTSSETKFVFICNLDLREAVLSE